MNKTQQKIKDWVISHFKYPERMIPLDHIWLDFMIVTLPAMVVQIAGFSLMIFIYMYLYNKYGFDKAIIILMCNIIFSINLLRKAFS